MIQCSVWRGWAALLVAAIFALGLSACSDDAPDNQRITEPVPVDQLPLDQWNFMDADGRVLILRGVNLNNVSKGPTGLPGSVEDTETDAKQFRDLGFNVTRYLIEWKNIEPEEGVYDDEYLQKVRNRLDILWAQGIYVILDMHQDVYGPYFGYNGAPDWAVEDDDIPYTQNTAGAWSMNYFAKAVQAAFDNFWDYENHPELQDHYIAMWKHTVEKLGDHPAVVGFDLMNEPHSGSDFNIKDMLSNTPPDATIAFDEHKLGPFYQRLINAIREVNTDDYILYEPRYGAPGDGRSSYIPRLHDPRKGAPHLFQAPHLYVFAVETSFDYNEKAANRVSSWETERKKERERDGTGMFLGEFGTYMNVKNRDQYMEDVLAVTEDMRIGFTAWAWDPGEMGMLGGGGRDPVTNYQPEGPFLDVISRPYPRAFAGAPESFSFDPDTQVLKATWTVDHSIDAPTEFFMARQRWYKDGWTLETTPSEGVDVEVKNQDETRELVEISVTDASVDKVSVTFSPQ